MPQRSEFSTEDAAIKPDGREESAEQPNEHQPVLPPEDAPSADEAEEAHREEEKKSEDTKQKQQEGAISDEDLAKYRWFKCQADDTQYGPGVHYYLHYDTMQSIWEEPDEPYWIYNVETQKADSAGLQFPKKKSLAETDMTETASTALATASPVADYQGYNPKIHGNYDPNADYAQWHQQKRPEETVVGTTHISALSGANPYASTMALNRFSGNAQASNLDPARHSDTAKSSRQMNAFFDVDAAANAHEGRSLKEERKQQKITKEQAKKYNEARKEKKAKKRLAFYKS